MITDKIILWDTKYGKVNCNLKKIMQNRHIKIYKLAKVTGLKYDVILRYFNDNIIKYDGNVLAKLCYSLNCNLDELLQYERSK